MNKLKKLLAAAVLSLAVVGIATGVASTTVYAEEVEYKDNRYELQTDGDWEYIVVPGGAVIMGYNSTQAAVSIPTTIGNGYSVIAVGCNTRSWDPEGAFEGNNSMQTLTIPKSVKYIDQYAFYECVGLQQVLIAEGVEEIGQYAFGNCSYLQRVQIKSGGLNTIKNSVFEGCSALDNFTIPSSVEYIGDHAFYKCGALSSIVIPDSVTYLGGGAFADCYVLAEAVIGEQVPEITSVSCSWTNNGAVDSYKNGCFERCTNLRSVTIGPSVTKIAVDAFANCGLLEINIPDNVITVEAGAFYNCDAMKNAIIGDGVKTMGHDVFYHCGKLETVSIGKRVKEIGEYAFAQNVSLKEITIPSNVRSLGGGSFYYCTSLKKAVVGNGVAELGHKGGSWTEVGNTDAYSHGMFENCTSLSEVKIGDGVVTIGTDAFANTSVVNITIPDNVVTVGKGAFVNCKSLKTIDIGEGTTSLGESVFGGDTALEDVHIGNGVVSIGTWAFNGCTSLKELMIPSSVTELGGGACLSCTSLETVIIGNGVTQLLSASGSWEKYGNSDAYVRGTFEHCTALKNVSLGSGITKIGVDCFAGTSIESLLIPAKVSAVEKGAFYGTEFKKIYFTGAAPTLDVLFSGSSPSLYKLPGKVGYDEFANYTFEDFTPIKVSFDLNDSDVFAIQPNDQYMTLEGGYVIKPIMPPVADGYRFLGWYKESACSNQWDFLSDKVTANTTLYAKWAKVEEVEPVKPEDLEQTAATSNTVTVSWKSVEGATNYDIYLDGVQVNTTTVTNSSFKLENLELDTCYEVTIVAKNDAGASEASLVKVVQTSDQALMLGDVDGNTKIEATDALTTLKFVVKLVTPSADQETAADVDGNGKIEAADALKILQYVVHLISSF